MATETNQYAKDGQCLAGADLSGAQYCAVALSAARTLLKNAVSGGKIFGVLQNKPIQGDACEVVLGGGTKMLSGAAFAAGPIMSDGNGKAIAAATTGSTIIGEALEAATGANQLISVRLGTVGVV